jgi:photosystem II stability/assembly factor-like uncharacterized protein
MKLLITLELILLFLATTFQSDNPPGWYQQSLPRSDLLIEDLYFLDSLTGHVICRNSTFDTAFIFRTTDGGNHWISTFKGDRYLTSIQFVDDITGYAVGSAPLGIVKKTTNGGLNWFSVSAISGLLKDVAFVNKDTGWICSADFIDGGIFKTLNGGSNWIRQLSPMYYPERLFFINKDTGWSSNENNKLFRTTNGGLNWIQICSFQNGVSDIFFISKDTGWITGGGNGNGIIRTTNSGYNWDTVNTPVVFGESKIFFYNHKIGWAGCAFNKILATKDGYNWGYQTTPLFSNYSVQFVDTLNGWTGTGGLSHTNDGGGLISSIINRSIEIPTDLMLYQNYPNPFNSSTKFRFEILKSADAKIKVYDISGKLISTLINERVNPGTYEYSFDASELTSGVYLYSLLIDEKVVDTKRMVLIK